MQTSGGGGYCDCGDSEAFLQHPLCAKHEALDVQKSTSAQVMETMPEEVKSRAKDLMSAVRSYIFVPEVFLCVYFQCLVNCKKCSSVF